MSRFLVRLGIYTLLTGLASLAALQRFDFPEVGLDDANIFFVYARNFAAGHGFVYNVGGERVEGFTSLLWTLICAGFFRLSATPEKALLATNVFLVSLGLASTSLVLGRCCKRSEGEATSKRLSWEFIFAALLLATPAYFTWNTITLMDNALWGTLLLLTGLLVASNEMALSRIGRYLPPLILALLLTRPEAYLWAPVFIGVLFVRSFLVADFSDAIRKVSLSVVTFAGGGLGLTAFRLLYFGYPLPNTFYAKVSPSIVYNVTEGSKYLAKYFASHAVVTAGIVCAALGTVHLVNRLFVEHFVADAREFLPALASVGLVVPVITGGDHFGSFRFYQSIYPLIVFALLFFIRCTASNYVSCNWRSGDRAIPSSITVIVFLVSLLLMQLTKWDRLPVETSLGDDFGIASSGRRIGTGIGDVFRGLEPLPSIGVMAAGGKAFSYSGEVVDLMGLNNSRMAHSKGDRRGMKNHAAFEKGVFMVLSPDIVMPRTVDQNKWLFDADSLRMSFANKALKHLFDDLMFLSKYNYAKARRFDSEDDRAIVGWYSNVFLGRLVDSEKFEVEVFNYE